MIKKLKLSIGNLGVRLIKFTSRKAKIDLIRLGYWENGLMKSHSFKDSGELYFITQFLPQHFSKKALTFFDVGANKGDYSALLRSSFPKSTIHSFEPNPNTFKVLSDRLKEKTTLVNCGIGEENGFLNLFFDPKNPTSVQASSDPEILKTIAKTTELTSEEIAIVTLDNYCVEHKIEHIDFLKIDTEGFELEALLGAKDLLDQGRINVIQFEFNEVNIVKRRFIKDFYDTLPGFDFYRLDEKRLIPLNHWQPIHEIFMFQNIVAIRK